MNFQMRNFVMWCLLLFSAAHAHAAVEVSSIFSDGMVLQRDRAVPVWGTADAGGRIRVEFDGRSVETTADEQGRWRLKLPPHAPGGPYRMRVVGADTAREFGDILVGDVWLASGQSNMEWPLSRAAGGMAEAAMANDANIRYFKVPHTWAGSAEDRLSGGAWLAATPRTAGEFSAVAYWFARELRATTGVPVGIIDASWGGSRIEAWMDAHTAGIDARAIEHDAQRMRQAESEATAATRRRLSAWGSFPADDRGWEAEQFDTAAWQPIVAPGLWESSGWEGMDGVAWYRGEFILDATQAAQGVRLGLGRIDDSDRAWVNGQRIGGMSGRWNDPRVYAVPARVLHTGRNTIAIRVTDTGGGGGIHGDSAELCLYLADNACRSLAGAWKFRVADPVFSSADGKQRMPTLLYNGMIRPLQPYALRGVLWYQGESNADTVVDAVAYRRQFPALIRQWRRQWRAPRMPFFWVQLANYRAGRDGANGSAWALLREAQTAALALPQTAQAVTIDIGDPADIHPTNKRDVARRLAHAARALVYAERGLAHTPTFRRARFVGDEARVEFAPRAALAVRGGSGGQAHGFALAGEDRVFHGAQAKIENGRVIVRSDQVPKPYAVRYAWNENPVDADLVDAEGRPVAPFRSDRW
ncbi:MAG: 9-O-acetylesterase [Lysobacteraceae bacterium]|nr:MAG: 9-O-acetylesterase [Xanthomonadaceae bacterium]